MPVTKTNGNSKVAEIPAFARKILLTLVGILLVYLIVLLGSMIRNNLQKYNYIGQADRAERMITVDGQGKITVKPDLGITTMGMVAEGKNVAEAQKQNTEVMNKLIVKLKELGVEEKDIQTANYNVYPLYDYSDDEGRMLRGYEVSQSVTIKIRNLDLADQILSLAGEVGANNVSGLQFTFDDDENYKNQARDLALEQVAAKAAALSKALGVRLLNVVAYNEYSGGDNYYGDKAYSEMAFGLGGGAPAIEPGSNDVILNVSVTFEIR